MEQYLGIDSESLIRANSVWTAREICQQPRVWREVQSRIDQSRASMEAWLGPKIRIGDLRIILCGAGTSAFIGDTAAAWFRKRFRSSARLQILSLSTTGLAADPAQFLLHDTPTLMISFARSGDSPESIACVELAEQLLTNCRHLVITCNSRGKLATWAQNDKSAHCIVLPEQTNDRSFAMTSSYSAMLVACLTLFTPDADQLERAAGWAERLLEKGNARIEGLAQLDFRRLVVLGSGCLLGTAREAALKCLELTAGRVVAIHESPLGFRHGPKIIVDDGTMIVHLQSSDPYVSLYDRDLLAELHGDARCAAVVELSPSAIAGEPPPQTNGPQPLDDAWLSLVYAVFCQMLAFRKAVALGVAADNPCPSGEVNRVVRGVTIHPFRVAHRHYG